MAISSSADWSLASTTNCCRRRTYHLLHTLVPTSQFASFSSVPHSNPRFFTVRFSGSPTPILEEEACQPHAPVIQFDVKFSDDVSQYSKPSGAENLNEFVCGLFEDPQTEELGYEYYQRLKERPEFRPEESTLEHVIRYLLRFRKWGSILSVSEDLKIYSVLPDVATCSILISKCIRSRKFRIAEAFLDVFQDSQSTEVAVSAFDSALRSYNKLHMYRSSVLVFERMISTKLTVADYSRCYLHAMEAYMKLGDSDKVVQLFQELGSERSLITSKRYWSVIYGILCESLGQSRRAFEALKYFRDMNKRGVINDSIYSTLICSFASLRKVDVAEELLREAKRKTRIKDPEVYFKLVLMYVDEGLMEKTLEVVKTMENAGIKVTDCILCAIINGFSKRRGFRAAISVYEQLVSKGHEPGQVTYASIINAYCRIGQYTEAEKVFSEMEQKGYDKCVVAYSSMVVMYGRTGKLREAMRLVAKMKERGCNPNVWIYNSLIDMHGRVKDLRQVEKLWNEMKRRKVAPDKVTYTSIIVAYSKAREFEKCIKFFKEYRMNGGEIDRAMAGVMVMVFSKVGQVDELVRLLRDMKMEGTGLDERLYQSSLNALTEAGMQVHARWLQESFKVA
ncbi:pentatricopeptide repeat-containing protein At5g13770, chloroplastic-like [Neltuma alba]|uniref:pentatricopeptide repeat-containing protein At5g13770, chloroplastic n=1 Tax=Neltuma alba TaxID=207710 RepID=UPI0010A40795|nr:pentatricopeptide repeat-containing protein At5g13770, chloroplastic-like [Prosopis alba]XP_028783223.1 pentatricopeptide repeat-containing protein At5g13770, chloroplastic-like [Prosopis alba]